MNILFLTLGRMESIEQHAIYPDLLREFREHGHQIYTVSANEKRNGQPTACMEDHGAHMLHVKIGNITKCGMIEKGISTLLIEQQYKKAIQEYFSDIRFDLVMYSTPPITLAGVVEFVKKRDGARSYLLLKDIFPQNAVDLGMMATTGPKSILYRMFRRKEKKLYALSDTIGCMSQANVDYVLKHNPEVSPDKVEICPNCVEVQDMSITPRQRDEIRRKYEIPLDKKVFVYGGNLGKPQGIPFLLECLKTQVSNPEAYFLIVGDGTEYPMLEAWFAQEKPSSMKLLKRLPKDDYDRMISACDVGMIFLDHRFTIPNFPSRLLAYMQAGLPVLACTDPNTDVGKVITEGGFGWWCESNTTDGFAENVRLACTQSRQEKAICAWKYLNDHYTTDRAYHTVIKLPSETGPDCR